MPGRIAFAIPPFVVAQNERRDRIGERHTGNDLGPYLRMNSDLLEFFLRQRARLRKNVLGHRQLADVVQERRSFHTLDLALGHADGLRKARGKDLHATNVRLAGAILRVDRQRQRFNRREVQIRDFLHVALLVLDAAQIDLVAAISEIQRKRGEHRDPVVRRPADDDRNTRGRRRAHEVARRTPEEILIPDMHHRLVRRQRNRRRDQRRVAEEIGACRADQRFCHGGQRHRRQAGNAAEGMKHRASRLHADDKTRHAEQRAIQRILDRHPERALTPRADCPDDHRLVQGQEGTSDRKSTA